ncbi:hypothetical protein [Streptomyces sp. NPDC060194]|uniref:hypothetical protein n=1 Tax=Streptomyces sp. NPDC060194 TaxID=3347069 RepID=UPI00364B86FB
MPDRPYTDDDLIAEAARQHAGLTEDPDFMGVGERMQNSEIESLLPPEEADGAEGPHWDDLLDEDEFDEAQRKIHDLVLDAADTSLWAVQLGADGLEPDEEYALTVNLGEKAGARILFAFDPDMPEDMRTALVQGIGETVQAALAAEQAATA